MAALFASRVRKAPHPWADQVQGATPIDFNEREPLLVEPGQYIEGDAAAAVQHDDPRGQVGVAFEVPIGFLFLR